MSRADWSFLEHLLEEGQEYSTGVGRVWLTILFLFRMLVLGTAAESAWDDEQADFVCNTRQPGCTAVCYDKAFPISHFRYFVLQVIFVSTPTIFYFGYVAIKVGRDTKEDGDKGRGEKQTDKGADASERRRTVAVTTDVAEEKRKGDGRKGTKVDKAPPETPKLKGRLLCAYALSILVKVLLEVGFIVGLWLLYDGFSIAAKFECKGIPCPHTVDCFVSRPTEKTIFTIYTQAIAAVSLLLNLIELLHLLQLAISLRLEKRYRAQRQHQNQNRLPREKQMIACEDTRECRMETSQSCKPGGHVDTPIQGQPACYSNPCESFGDLAIEVNRRPGEAESDVLPSYTNCMGALRTAHSPRVHYKKHAQHTQKTSKGARVGRSKQMHYV
ncbi:gap junction protein alpha 4 [Brachionichthys hirsutus]|uniref:gap junction protein alpha 4 n=1 Tax=Brachionichthys hirsutus TaxID=412623 RepID=UPI003604ACC8